MNKIYSSKRAMSSDPLTLPDMTVETRVSTTAHTVPVPNTTTTFLCEQLQKATIMNHDAATGAAWPEATVSILIDTCKLSPKPTTTELAVAVSKVTGFNTWRKVARFVVDDMCADFFNLCLSYLVRINATHVNDEDFIDGSGIGYLKTYIDRLKITLEQAFDAKYFYQVKRPLVFSKDNNNVDLSRVANAIHPGHWSYPAGHGTKFFTAVEVLNSVFTLTTEQYRNLYIAAHVAAMGRSGNLIHYPVDNDAGGYLTTLPEFNP